MLNVMKPVGHGATTVSVPIRNALGKHAVHTANVQIITASVVCVVMALVQEAALLATVPLPVKLPVFVVRLLPVRIPKMLVKTGVLQAAVIRGNAMGPAHVPITQMEPFAKQGLASMVIGTGTHFAPVEAARRLRFKIVAFMLVPGRVVSRLVPVMVSAQLGRGVSMASVPIKSIPVIRATVRPIVRLVSVPTMCAATLHATVHASLASMQIRIYQMVPVDLSWRVLTRAQSVWTRA